MSERSVTEKEKADRLFEEIEKAGKKGLTASEIRTKLGNEFLRAPLDHLQDSGKVVEDKRKTEDGQRWVTVYIAPEY